MCLYSKLIQNPKYKPNKKNGGNIPPVRDERMKWVPIGCEQCIECRRQKARGWQVRLLEDIRKHKNGKFIAFTFSNEAIKELRGKIDEKLEGYEIDNEIATYAVRHFLENWRKKYKKSIRHWLVTELGHKGTENIHIHGILWSDTPLEKFMDEVQEKWSYGFIWRGKKVKGKLHNYVNEATVNYMVKYITKIDVQHKKYKALILTSPGIGGSYTERIDSKNNKYKEEGTQETYRTRSGHKMSMPNYWRNKIYSEEEREKLWIEKLDKQERWICGEKVDISKGEEEYYGLLEFHRKRNKQLGYGTDEKNWSREVYERERRNLIIKYRIKNASADGLRPEVKQKGMDYERNGAKTAPSKTGNTDINWNYEKKCWEESEKELP